MHISDWHSTNKGNATEPWISATNLNVAGKEPEKEEAKCNKGRKFEAPGKRKGINIKN